MIDFSGEIIHAGLFQPPKVAEINQIDNYLKNGRSKILENKSPKLVPSHIAVAIIPELKIACSITAMAYLPLLLIKQNA